MVRIGETDYECELGHQDKERNLAALVVAEPVNDATGTAFKSFPTVAEEPPRPAQALGVLVGQPLYSQHGSRKDGGYLCFTYGYVSLLRGQGETLLGLAGLEANFVWFGNVVFDDDGKIYGVATDYLRTSVEQRFGATYRGFLIFSPIYTMANAAKLLALENPDKILK